MKDASCLARVMMVTEGGCEEPFIGRKRFHLHSSMEALQKLWEGRFVKNVSTQMQGRPII